MTEKLTVILTPTGWVLDNASKTYLAPTEAASKQVMRKVYGYAFENKYDFPVAVDIKPTASKTLPLLLNLDQSTQPRISTPTAPSTAPEQTQTDTKNDNAEELHELAPEPAHTTPKPATIRAQPTDENTSLTDLLKPSPEKEHNTTNNKKTIALSIAGLFALATLATGTTLAIKATHPEHPQPQETTTSPTQTQDPNIYTLPANTTALAFAGNTLISTAENKLTLINVTTGENTLKEPFEIDAANTRVLSNDSQAVIDGNKGKTLLIDGENQKTVDGVLLTRGTAPIAVSKDFKSYTLPGKQTQKAPENSVVLGATDKNVLFIKAPATIEYSTDHRSVAIKAPAEGAKITGWIAATESRAVTTWSKDEKNWLVVTDTHDNGKTTLSQEIPNAQAVSYQSQNVIIDKKYLKDDKLQEICEPGKWLNSQRWCSTDNHWTNGNQTLDQEPQLLTDTYILTDNTVKEH